jgi:hypothetical protein
VSRVVIHLRARTVTYLVVNDRRFQGRLVPSTWWMSTPQRAGSGSAGSHQVTHVLLQEGHVFGRKVVAIPIGAVTGVGQNGIQLNITKQQVKDLPSGWHRSPG